MTKPQDDAPPEQVLHRAARLEDALNRTAARMLTRRGWKSRIITYTGYGSQGWVRVFARVLLAPPTVGRPEGAMRGWRHFLSAKVAGVPVTVDVGGVHHVVETERGGYIDVVLPSSLPQGWGEVTVSIVGSGMQRAPVRVVGADEHLGIISDIDDTVLVTALPRPLLAFWNTFVRPEESRKPVPGMAEVYAGLRAQTPDAFVVYVSTGAWNVAPALRRFLARKGFPEGPLVLTDWGPTPQGWFRSGQDHKRSTLRRLVDDLPQLRWVLVGDDGQHDPQLYDELVWARPDDVRLVAVRQLGVAEQVLTHGLPVPLTTARGTGRPRPGDTVPWVFAPNGYELLTQLQERGLLDEQDLGREPRGEGPPTSP